MYKPENAEYYSLFSRLNCDDFCEAYTHISNLVEHGKQNDVKIVYMTELYHELSRHIDEEEQDDGASVS